MGLALPLRRNTRGSCSALLRPAGGGWQAAKGETYVPCRPSMPVAGLTLAEAILRGSERATLAFR